MTRRLSIPTHPVTSDLMTTADAARCVPQVEENEDGSPGRARTTDLVINSSSDGHLWRKKVEERQRLFWWPFFLVPRTETSLNFSER